MQLKVQQNLSHKCKFKIQLTTNVAKKFKNSFFDYTVYKRKKTKWRDM
jgi:hypothetical protein